LKTGAKAFVLTTTGNDYRCGKGKHIAENTYILDIADTNEEGMVLHFLNKDEVVDVFKAFKKIGIGQSEVINVDSDRKDSHWIIILEK
jgi:hypothetical protein